jgi:hypothetical protein
MISAPHARKLHPTFSALVISMGLHALLIWSVLNPPAPQRNIRPLMHIKLADPHASLTPLPIASNVNGSVESTAGTDAAVSSAPISVNSANDVFVEGLVQPESMVVGTRPRGWGGREYVLVEQRGDRTLMEVMPFLQSALQQTASIDCVLEIAANSYVARLRCENPSDQQLLLSMLSGRFSFQDQITQTFACVHMRNSNISVEKKCTSP